MTTLRQLAYLIADVDKAIFEFLVDGSRDLFKRLQSVGNGDRYGVDIFASFRRGLDVQHAVVASHSTGLFGADLASEGRGEIEGRYLSSRSVLLPTRATTTVALECSRSSSSHKSA